MVNLLIGLAMSLSILSAAGSWAALQWQSDRLIVQRSQAQQSIRAILDTLVHDIRRAQFKVSPEDFQMGSHQILFSVNRNDNAQRDNNECSGFRLNGKTLQTQTSCQPVVWTNLNDTRNSNTSLGDLIQIELTSQTDHEHGTSKWQRHVRLRNVHNRFRPTSELCTNKV